jgi:hypothetical protein
MGDGRWEVDAPDAVATFDEKADAVIQAREWAIRLARAVLMIRDEAGSIEAEHDYERDRPEG